MKPTIKIYVDSEYMLAWIHLLSEIDNTHSMLSPPSYRDSVIKQSHNHCLNLCGNQDTTCSEVTYMQNTFELSTTKKKDYTVMVTLPVYKSLCFIQDRIASW